MKPDMEELLDAELVAAEARVDELERFVREVAERTVQRDLNREAHRLLGHEPNPLTVQLLAELAEERR